MVLSIDDFLSNSASESNTDSVLEVLFGVHAGFHSFFFWGENGYTTSSASWYNRDLVHEIIVRHKGTEKGVTTFVISYEFLTLVTESGTLLLETNLNSVD